MGDYTDVVRNVFLATHMEDYLIPWGDDGDWRERVESAPPETIDALSALGLYWKFSRNTAISPWMSMKIAGSYVDSALGVHQPHLPQQLWAAFLGQQEQILFLMGSQTLAYCGLYFAYEHFVRECCFLKDNSIAPSKLKTTDGISDALIDNFSEALEGQVWSDDKIEAARLARNALVHNCGKPAEPAEPKKKKTKGRCKTKDELDLKKIAPDLLTDGLVCIHPRLVSELFTTLKSKVDLLLKAW